MKEKLIRGITAALNGIYSIFKLFPVKKKITYISRQSNVLPVDFDLVIREMERRHPEYQQVTLIKMIGKSLPEKIGYCFHMFRQMYHIATSEMVVLDTYCIAVSVLHQRKSLVVIQMWHALGAMKKFGYSILDKGEGTKRSLAEAMQMHKNYTYIFSSSEFCCRFFAEAFNASIDQMVVMPLPRLDLLFDPEHIANVKKKILSQYPRLADKTKKTIVYAPTFRKEGGSFEEKELEAAAEKLAKSIDYERYNLVAKFHPLSDVKLQNENVIQDKIFSTIDFCQMADAVILPMTQIEGDYTPEELMGHIRDDVLGFVDMLQVSTMQELMELVASGFGAVLIDGVPYAVLGGLQAFMIRGIGEPSAEMTIRGSREGFTEAIRVNISMIRRRMRTPDLKFERMIIGSTSQTSVAICYLNSAVSKELLARVRAGLRRIDLPSVFASGYLSPFLENKSIFNGVGLSERPDTVCGKIMEGRVAIIIDGTPNVMVVPHLFVENFQSFDDYTTRPFYATFTRILK